MDRLGVRDAMRVCAHSVLLARIGHVFCVENVSNNAAITVVKTPPLIKLKNTPVCIDGTYF